MKINNLMSKDVEIVSPATSIETAAQVMRDRDVGILPVGEGDPSSGWFPIAISLSVVSPPEMARGTCR